jgi:hypothetical protein
MNDRERRTEPDEEQLDVDGEPAIFILETVYKGSRRTIADGVAFPHPNERVIINWRGSDSIELIDTVEALYEKYGDSPRVMWKHNEELFTEVEPEKVV